MAIFKCENCGLTFYWEIVRPYVAKNYDIMIKKGTLDPEAYHGERRVVKIGKRRYIMTPVSFHPKYYHPTCPACGGRSSWVFSKEKGGKHEMVFISIFELS